MGATARIDRAEPGRGLRHRGRAALGILLSLLLAAGSIVAAPAAHAEEPVYASGQITGLEGTTANVIAYTVVDGGWEPYSLTWVSGDGPWSLELAPGWYRFGVETTAPGFADAVYPGITTPHAHVGISDGVDVLLADSRDDLDFDIEPLPLATIGGTVTVDGEPLTAGYVELWDLDFDFGTGEQSSVWLDESGAYEFTDVEPGAYLVCASDANAEIAYTGCYETATTTTYDYGYLNSDVVTALAPDATPVVVDAAGTPVADVDLELVPYRTHVVSGTLTTTGGGAVDGVVVAYRPDGAEAASAWSDDGVYALRVEPGSYSIGFHANGDYWPVFADDVITAEPRDPRNRIVDVAGDLALDFEATPSGPTEITGTVAVSVGTPSEFIQVDLRRAVGDGWTTVDSTWLEEPGAFAFGDPGPGLFRVVASAGIGYTRDAAEVAVPGGGAVALEIEPAEQFPVSGSVSAPGAETVTVTAYAAVDESGSDWTWAASTTIGAGDWTLDLPAGSYRIGFDDDNVDTYRPQFFDGVDVDVDNQVDAPGIETIEVADAVTGIDADLAIWPAVTGTVVDAASGDPLPDVRIVPYIWDDWEGAWSPWWSETTTDSTGAFRVRPPTDTRFTLRAAGLTVTPQYLSGSALPESSDGTGTYLFTGDELALPTPTFELDSLPTHTLSGTVTLAGETVPHPEVTVEITTNDAETGETITVDLIDLNGSEDGSWSTRVPAGVYSVAALAWSNDYRAQSRSVEVIDADVTVDVDLPLAPRIHGVIRNADGAIVDDARVTLYTWNQWDETWDSWMDWPVDEAGEFSFTDAPTGTPLTLAITDADHLVRYLGGGGSAPTSPTDAAATFQWDGDASVDLGDPAIVAVPRPKHAISGTVSGLADVTDGSIRVHRILGENWTDEVASVELDEDGSWSVDVVDGDYFVEWTGWSSVSVVYDGVEYGDLFDGDPVHVNGAPVAGIDITSRPLPVFTGSIAGQPENAETRISVLEWDEFAIDWQVRTTTWTYGAESFRVTARPGVPTIVRIDGYGIEPLFLPGGDTAPTAPDAEGVFTLGAADVDLGVITPTSLPRRAVGGTVVGVADPTTVTVRAYWFDPEQDYWTTAATTEPAADGSWSIPLTDGTYRFSFSDDGTGRYLRQVYPFIDTTEYVGSLDTTSDVTVDGAAVTGIDATLSPRHAVTGRLVVAGGGTVPANAQVTLLRWNDAYEEWREVGWDTPVDGAFALYPEEPGDYALAVRAWPYASPALPAGPDAPGAFSAGTTDVAIGDVVLEPRPMHAIGGTVTATGTAFVEIYRFDDGWWTYATTVETDEDGAWSTAVPDGSYRFVFWADSHGTQVWDGLTEWESVDDEAARTLVVDGADATESVDATLAPTPGIRSTVRDADGPLGVPTQLYRWVDGDWNFVAALEFWGGDRVFTDLEAGDYTLYFDTEDTATDAPSQWLNGTSTAPASPAAAGVIHYTDTSAQLEVDHLLVGGGPAPATTASGLVIDDATDEPVAGAEVTVTRGGRTYAATTDADGVWTVSPISAGSYTATVFPVDGKLGDAVTFTAPAPTEETPNPTVTAPTIELRAPAGIGGSTGVGVTQSGGVFVNPAGVPTVFYGAPIAVTVGGQTPGSTGTWTFVVEGRTVSTGSFTESASGTLTASIPAPFPYHGNGVVTYSITAPGQPPVVEKFDIYIDPSGIVVDQYGAPVAGATVTVLHATTEDGTYAALPANDPLLAPWTPTNPQTTGADGRFQWDVAAGWYKVQVAYPGAETVTTPAMQVPPERTELVIEIVSPDAVTPTPIVEPSYVGAVAVGSEIAFDAGEWAEDIVVDGVEWIIGDDIVASGFAYTPSAGDLGDALTARVLLHREVVGNLDGIADEDGGSSHVFEFHFTDEVAIGEVQEAAVTAGTVSITPGSGAIGSTYTAVLSEAWGPAPVSFEYQWLRDGVTIASATSATYALQEADLGHTLSVRVIGSKAGYASATEVSAGVAIALGTITPGTVTIDGAPTPGALLTAATAGWPAGVAFAYEWTRNGVAIAGATGGTYTLTDADLGTTLGLELSVTKVGYTPTSAAATKAVPAGILTLGKPKITGTARVGATLKRTGVTATPTATVTYQWKRNGSAISGATASSYKLTSKDLGKKITVTARAVRPGYTTIQSTSAATSTVTISFRTKPTPKITGTANVGKTLKVKVGSWGVSGVTYRYQWKANGKVIKGATKSSLKLKSSMRNKRITVTVTATKRYYVTATVTSKQTKKVKR